MSVFSIRHSTYPEKWLDEASFLQRIRILLPFPDFDKEISWIFAGKLRHSCRNFTCVSRLRLQVSYSFENWEKFFVPFVFWLIHLHFCWFFSCRVCKTALYVPEDLFEEKLLVLDFFSILQPFQNLSVNFSFLWQKLCGSNVKSALFPPVEQNEGNIVLKKCINF